MKIPLEIQNLAGAVRPTLLFSLRIPQLRGASRSIRALIDTGSPFSFISDADAKLMQIPQDLLQPITRTFIAGNNMVLCELDKAMQLRMFDENKKIQEIPFQLLVALNDGKVKTQSISILGADFLEKNKLALYYDPAGRIGYLEKV